MIQISKISYHADTDYCTYYRLPGDNGWAVNVVIWSNGKKCQASDVTRKRPNQERAFDYIKNLRNKS